MVIYWELIVAAFLAYLIGSIPFGLVIARFRGVDITRVGSGNIGATNVTRNLGKKWGALTLLLDALKGLVPTYLTLVYLGYKEALLVGTVAILGHCFSIFLKFRGGKGVATTIGALLGANPLLGGGFVLFWLLGFLGTRISSFGALTAASLMPIYAATVDAGLASLVFCYFVMFFLFYTHRENLQRIAKGTEGRMKELLGKEDTSASAHAKKHKFQG